MAVSSWFSVKFPRDQEGKYRIEVTENWQNMSENYTNITVKVTVTNVMTTGSGAVHCTIDGTEYKNVITGSNMISMNGSTIFENTLNIYHNADGTKSLWISSKLALSKMVSDDQGFTVTLTTIARKSTIASISGDWFNSDMTVTIDQKSSSFTTSVFVKTPNSDWVNVIWKQSGTSFTFTLPMSLVTSIPNATECSGTVKIRTYNGDTEIGDDDWGKWMGVPDWVKPSISNVQLDTDTQVNGWWGWVQWKSKLRARTTASGSYGSTISTIRVDYDGSQYWGSDIWTNILANSGSRPVTVHVWDSRNRYASWSGSINVEWYQNPWGTLTAYRCDANGNRDDTSGTKIKVLYSGDRCSINGKNTFMLKVDHRVQGGDWEIHNDVETNQTTSGTELILNYNSETFSLEKAYEIRLRIADWYAQTTYTVPISTAFVLIDFKAGGRGIAFGKVSQSDTFEVNMELDLYAGRDNNQNYGADLNFCKVSNESQKIGWCGGTPSGNTLLQLFRHTDSSSGNSGTLLDVDKWNNCYYRFGVNYFMNEIRFYGSSSERIIKFDGSPSYMFFHNPNGSYSTGNIGCYNTNGGAIWEFNHNSQQLLLKSGYGTISDERVKHDIDEFSNWDDFYNFYMSLKPKTFKYNNDMRNETHIGLIAQEVAESIVDNNLNNEKLCVVKATENKDMDDGREYNIVYQELIALNIRMIQKQENEIQELNNMIAKQQEEIDQLKDMVNQLVNQGGK